MEQIATEKLLRFGTLLNVKESAEKTKEGTPTGRTRIYLEVAWVGGKYAKIQADISRFELIKSNGLVSLRQFSNGQSFAQGGTYHFTLESSPKEVRIFKEQTGFVSIPHTLLSMDEMSFAQPTTVKNPTEEKKK